MALVPATSQGGAGGLSLLTEIILGADTASIDFTGVASSFRTLFAYGWVRGTTAATSVVLRCEFNADGANHYSEEMSATGTTLTASEILNLGGMFVCNIAASTAPANVFSPVEFVIPYYAQTLGNKAAVGRGGAMKATTTTNIGVDVATGYYASTTAVNEVTFFPASGNLLSGSRMALYGL